MTMLLYYLFRHILTWSLVLALVAFGLYSLVGTERGTRLLLNHANLFLSGTFEYESVHGRLIDSIALQNAAYRSPTLNIQIKNLQLSWKPIQLFKKKLHINTLAIEEAQIIVLKDTKKTPSTDKNIFSFSQKLLEVENLTINHLIVHTNTQPPLMIDHLTAHFLLDKKFSLSVDTTIHEPLAGNIKLEANSTIPLTNISDLPRFIDNLQLNMRAALQSGDNTIQIMGTLQNQWNIQYHINLPNLTNFYAAMKGSVQSNGKITGARETPAIQATASAKKLQFKDTKFQGNFLLDGQLQLNKNNLPDAQLTLQLQQGQLRHQLTDQEIIIPLRAQLKTQLDAQGLRSTLAIFMQQTSILDAELSLPHYQLQVPFPEKQVLQARLDSQLNNKTIERIITLPDSIKDLRGVINTHLTLSGTLKQPLFNGTVDLVRAQINIPQLGIVLRQLSARILINPQQLQYTASVNSGDGTLQLHGNTSVNTASSQTHLTLRGNNFLANNTPTLLLSLSPNISIRYLNGAWYAEGNVLIPKAKINLGDSTKTVTLPPETRIIDASGKMQESTPLKIFSKTTWVLGDKVKFSGAGFTGRLKGSLLVTTSPQQPILATGRLSFPTAHYNLQGEILNADHSKISYINAPLDNPELNIRASKHIKLNTGNTFFFTQESNLIVGVEAKGSANNPQITLFSEPPGWSQADILSLLVLGRPAETAFGSNVQLLAKALEMLNPKLGVNQLTQQAEQAFGFSTIEVESGLMKTGGETQQTTSLVFGKQLSPRLHLSYSAGIYNAVSVIRLRYLLSKNWLLQTNSSSLGNGADVLYKIER